MSNLDYRRYNTIISPVVTEKSTLLGEHGKYVFKVQKDANKKDIKDAVEKIFNVNVLSVNVINQSGKKKRFRGFKGNRPDSKKAIISIASGQVIDYGLGV